MGSRRNRTGWALAAMLAVSAICCGAESMFTEANALALRAEPPGNECKLVAGNAPAYIFYPGQSVDLTFEMLRGDGAATQEVAFQVQSVHTRKPNKSKVYIDPYGFPDILNVDGKPEEKAVTVSFGKEKKATVEVKDLPVPDRFGTYCLVLVKKEKKGKERRLLVGSVARVPEPRADRTVENTPVFGQGVLPGISRIGIKGIRCEISWRPPAKEGEPYDWTNYDKMLKQIEEYDLQAMFTLGGVGSNMYGIATNNKPVPAAVPPTWNGNPYWGQCDWGCAPKHFDKYEAWVKDFAERYWKDGKGGLWGFENYNEPWEGGGISGYARDCLSYREWQKRMARAAHSVDKRIRICAASSIMNTEDKLFPKGKDKGDGYEFDDYIDVFTDHYVPPYSAYGPMVAQAHGKFSIENETWLVISEYLLPQIMCQWLASGQRCVMPFHPNVLFEKGCPTTVPVATAAFNYFVTGLRFERLVFQDHLPWVYQFGKNDDPRGVCVVLGQLLTRGGPTPQDNPDGRLWAQVDRVDGGTLTIDNADGALRFYDVAGNPAHEGEKTVTLALDILPVYIQSDKGPGLVAERLKQARMEGKYPCEILPRDFIRRIDDKDCRLHVTVTNRLNRPVRGVLSVLAPEGFEVAGNGRAVELKAGEEKLVEFAFDKVKEDPSNQYPFSFALATDAGACSYDETLNVTVAVKGSRTVDGDLKDWEGVPAIVMVGEKKGLSLDEIARRPWLKLQEELPDDAMMAEVRMAWDADYLYVAARVRDATPQDNKPRMEGRDEDAYFHSAASDEEEPWKSWLEENAKGQSFAQVPYIYKKKPFDNSYTGDQLQLAFDTTQGWHDLEPVTEVPYGFHCVPDTDYEFCAYLCADGKSELWNLLAPGIPRIHDWPHQPKGETTTNPTPGAKHVVRQDGDVRIYEIAIPKAAIKELALKAGTTFDFAFFVSNNQGPKIEYGKNKAVTKWNGLTIHPYWHSSASCDIEWALVE